MLVILLHCVVSAFLSYLCSNGLRIHAYYRVVPEQYSVVLCD